MVKEPNTKQISIPKENIEFLDIEKIIEYPTNPRLHTEKNIDRITSVLKEFGQVVPILVNKENVILDGHLRLKAAKKLGWNQIQVLRNNKLSKAQEKALRIIMNKSVEWTTWDTDLLKIEVENLKELKFNTDMLGIEDYELHTLEDAPGIPNEQESDNISPQGFIRVNCDSTIKNDLINDIKEIINDKNYNAEIKA
tara:strand:- start:118 stop:705 length:588 start_codon:yes stop_codon:yes gene_type:complete